MSKACVKCGGSTFRDGKIINITYQEKEYDEMFPVFACMRCCKPEKECTCK